MNQVKKSPHLVVRAINQSEPDKKEEEGESGQPIKRYRLIPALRPIDSRAAA